MFLKRRSGLLRLDSCNGYEGSYPSTPISSYSQELRLDSEAQLGVTSIMDREVAGSNPARERNLAVAQLVRALKFLPATYSQNLHAYLPQLAEGNGLEPLK